MIPILILVVFFLGVLSARWFVRNQEHRSEPASVADLLGPAYLVDPGVILQKDGSFMAGWSFWGPDVSSKTDDELNALSRQVNDALLPYANQWMFHFDAVRRASTDYAPEGAFPDPVTRLVDWDRRRAYQSGGRKFETVCYLVATYLPDPEQYSRMAGHFMQGEVAAVGWEQELAVFRQALGNLEDRLHPPLTMTRLSSDELLTHLHGCLTGLDHPVLTPAHGAYLNMVLCDFDLVGGSRMVVNPGTPNERHLRFISLTGLPGETYSGLLNKLGQQPYSYRWSSRSVPLGRETAAGKIRQIQIGWYRKRKGAGSMVSDLSKREKTAKQEADEQVFEDSHAIAMTRGTQAALADNASGEVRFCHFTSTLIVMEPNAEQADRVAKNLVKFITDQGFTCRLETINSFDAYLGAFPGDGYHNLRRLMVSSRNVTDMLPLTSAWPGLAKCPCAYYPPNSPALMWTDTEGSTPFRVNLHSVPADVGHTLTIGQTGGGKSTFVALLVAQYQRYPNAQVFVFDKGNSYWLLTAAAGGQHYDIDPGSGTMQFQPLANVDKLNERAWAAVWVEILLELQGMRLDSAQRNALQHAIGLLGKMERCDRTITSLMMQVQDEKMRAALQPYTLSGVYGMLDAERDGLSVGSFVTFEMHKIMDMGEKITIPVLLYLFHRLEQRLDGSPTLVVVEEAWQPLTNSVFAGRIQEWLLTWRKRNAAVMLVTQSLSQLHELPNRHILLESCPTRFFLPNPGANAPEQAQMYRDVGLNDREIDVLKEAVPKRDYYYSSPLGSRLFQAALGPVPLAFLSARKGLSNEETIARARELVAVHGSRWPGRWLEEVGLKEAAEQFYAFLGGENVQEAVASDDGAGGRRRDGVGTLAAAG